MAISGIGLQSTAQFASRSNGQRALNKAGNNSQLSSQGNKTEASSSALNTSNLAGTNQAALLTTVPQLPKTSQPTSNPRQNLVEVETARKRFQLKGDKGRAQGGTGKAIQSFLEVADFERKDDLSNLVGIDIYI